MISELYRYLMVVLSALRQVPRICRARVIRSVLSTRITWIEVTKVGTWLLLAYYLLTEVMVVAPLQLDVLRWKMLQMVVYGLVGYALDRTFFSYASPRDYHHRERTRCCFMIRRMCMVLGAMFAGSMAV